MAIQTRRYQPSDRAAVERLNRRLAEGGIADCVYPEESEAQGRDGEQGALSTHLWVASSGNEIHGGVWLREQQVWIGGADRRAGWVKYPVSESLLDKNLGGVPTALLFRLVREQPHLMIAGMGGHHQPIARLVASMGWTGITVPSFLYLAHPTRFLLRFNRLNATAPRRTAARILGYSGLGALAWKVYTTARRRQKPFLKLPFQAKVAENFGPWANNIWEDAKHEYSLCSRRDAASLNHLYGSGDNGLYRVVVTRDSTPIGFACAGVFAPQHSETLYGPLAVGTIFDAFGSPAQALPLMTAATQATLVRGADIIVANMAHPDWGQALQRLGYVAVPSNYAFYCSPAVSKIMAVNSKQIKHIHVTRADSHFPEGLQYLSGYQAGR